MTAKRIYRRLRGGPFFGHDFEFINRDEGTFQMQAENNQQGFGTRGQRALILTVLIVTVTFFWVLMLMYASLPIWALAGIGLLSLLVLSVATAWTAMAFPSRSKQ